MSKQKRPTYEELEARCENLREQYQRMVEVTEHAVNVGWEAARLTNQSLEEVLELRARLARNKSVTLN